MANTPRTVEVLAAEIGVLRARLRRTTWLSSATLAVLAAAVAWSALRPTLNVKYLHADKITTATVDATSVYANSVHVQGPDRSPDGPEVRITPVAVWTREAAFQLNGDSPASGVHFFSKKGEPLGTISGTEVFVREPAGSRSATLAVDSYGARLMLRGADGRNTAEMRVDRDNGAPQLSLQHASGSSLEASFDSGGGPSLDLKGAQHGSLAVFTHAALQADNYVEGNYGPGSASLLLTDTKGASASLGAQAGGHGWLSLGKDNSAFFTKP